MTLFHFMVAPFWFSWFEFH